MENKTLIQAEDISFSFNNGLILNGVSLMVKSGEFVGLIGANGAGKTTLLKILGGLLKTTAGSLHLKGTDFGGYSAKEVARLIAHVPQTTAIGFAFTAREIVLMGRSPHLGRFTIEGEEDRRIAEWAMAQMGIDHLGARFINTLSGGEQQRTFIARALAQQGELLLLDEPTANLDVGHQLDVLGLVSEQVSSGNLAVVAAIHDLNLAAQFCDRLILLHEGKILADDTPDAVLIPENLHRAFGINAQLYRDPFTDELRLSLRRREDAAEQKETFHT